MDNVRNLPDWLGDSVFMQTKARGHAPDGLGGFNEVPWVSIPMYPAGALRGTVEDLAQFALALMPSQNESSALFNSRDTLDLMLSPSYSNPRVLRGTNHGFISYHGFFLGHSGGTPGFNAEFAIVPTERFGIVLLSNATGGGVFNGKIVDLLIGTNVDDVTSLTDILPDASSVAGTYVRLNRNEGNILEPFNALFFHTNIQISAIDVNTISVVFGGETLTYKQVEPYVFRVMPAETALAHNLSRMFYRLYFTIEDGQPVGVSISSIESATIETFSQSMAAFIGGISILLVGATFFLIMSIAVLIGFLRRKDKKISRFNLLSNGLLVCGMLFVINFILLETRLIMASSFIQTRMTIPHVLINYILLAMSAVLFVISIMISKKETVASKRKILHIFTVAFLTLLIIVLWHWNYFVMM